MSMTDNAAKTCTKCSTEKEISAFGKDGQKKDGLSPHCRACRAIMSKRHYENNKEKVDGRNRKWYKDNGHTKEFKDGTRNATLKRKYGIDVSDYNGMFIEQGGRCAICGKHQSEFVHSLVVDHNHETGKVRGLLCRACNLGIGMLGDVLEVMKNAIKYVEASQ